MTIELAPEFDNPKDCLVIIALMGSEDEIEKQLVKILQDHRSLKPCQGITIGNDYVTQVITPVWNGKKY